VVGSEGDLDGDAVDVDRLRDISEEATAELPQREPRKLVRVLAADECIVEDVDVVEVVVGVMVGEVGGAGQKRRARLRLAAVVAHDELLVEDLRVEVALDFDPVAKQRREDDPIHRKRLTLSLQVLGGGLLVGAPLQAIDRLSLRLPARGVGLRRFRHLLELGADVVLLDKHVDRDALPACVNDCFCDGIESISWTAISSDLRAPPMKSTIACSRLSAAPSSVGPR
jgi:hypothetical protein